MQVVLAAVVGFAPLVGLHQAGLETLHQHHQAKGIAEELVVRLHQVAAAGLMQVPALAAMLPVVRVVRVVRVLHQPFLALP